jgi:hypothetical protein
MAVPGIEPGTSESEARNSDHRGDRVVLCSVGGNQFSAGAYCPVSRMAPTDGALVHLTTLPTAHTTQCQILNGMA